MLASASATEKSGCANLRAPQPIGTFRSAEASNYGVNPFLLPGVRVSFFADLKPISFVVQNETNSEGVRINLKIEWRARATPL